MFEKCGEDKFGRNSDWINSPSSFKNIVKAISTIFLVNFLIKNKLFVK